MAVSSALVTIERDSCSSHICPVANKKQERADALELITTLLLPPLFQHWSQLSSSLRLWDNCSADWGSRRLQLKNQKWKQFWTIGTGLTDCLFQNNWKHCILILLSLCWGEISIIYRQAGLWNLMMIHSCCLPQKQYKAIRESWQGTVWNLLFFLRNVIKSEAF